MSGWSRVSPVDEVRTGEVRTGSVSDRVILNQNRERERPGYLRQNRERERPGYLSQNRERERPGYFKSERRAGVASVINVDPVANASGSDFNQCDIVSSLQHFC